MAFRAESEVIGDWERHVRIARERDAKVVRECHAKTRNEVNGKRLIISISMCVLTSSTQKLVIEFTKLQTNY